jgi:gamma-glutamyl-gamma-aminobutyrate hydrolase PuuD
MVRPRLVSMRKAFGSRIIDDEVVRPLIGITTSEVRVAPRLPHTPQADPARPEMALGMGYARAIATAGGLPVVLPPVDTDGIEPLLEQLAGMCLSGGLRRRAALAARADVAGPRRV